jgi:N-formylglutamate amidohydrolase
MTDAYTDELFPMTPAGAGRAIFSPESIGLRCRAIPFRRTRADGGSGNGVAYTHTSISGVLRAQPDPADRQKYLDQWYRPHHSKLEQLVNDVAERSGICVIVDCHRFPSVALPYELDQTSHSGLARSHWTVVEKLRGPSDLNSPAETFFPNRACAIRA